MIDDLDEIMAAEHAAASGENNSREDDAMPELPNGIGLDYEDVRKVLAMKHETAVSLDDPMLMVVTICNAFLGELEKVHNKHNDAVTNIMASQSAKYIDGVKKTTDALSKTLADTSVDAIKKIFDSHAAELKSNRLNSRWCTAIIAVSALINVAVMALGIWR